MEPKNKPLDCNHNWNYKAGSDNIRCFKCNWFYSFDKRWKFQICLKQICSNCIKKYFSIETKLRKSQKIQILQKIKII